MTWSSAGPAAAAAAAMLALTAGGAQAQGFGMGHFDQKTGEAIWTGVCQGCHMPQAQGAVGAGAYPALAGDQRLAAAVYPVTVVIHGQKAMPNFGPMLDDDQVAAVVNYVRSHFGNHYADTVTPAQVKAVRSGQ
jgi:mono/diheme cytochrome c family protein